MKKIPVLIIIFLLFLTIVSIKAQEEVITWQKRYGGSDGDGADSIQQTEDGGYIVAGSSNSIDIPGVKNNGPTDCYILKLDSKGNIIWQKMYGGNGVDWAYSVLQTKDGGYIVAGVSDSKDIPGLQNKGNFDYYILKLDPKGNIQWQKMYGGSGNEEYKCSIQQTEDGGYILAGTSDSKDIPKVNNNGKYDYYILKLDVNGNIIWQKMYGGREDDEVYSVQQTKDGGYILAGDTESKDIPGLKNNGLFDIYIIKLDSKGNIQWQKLYGGSDNDGARSILQDKDGEYIVGGWSFSGNLSGIKNKGNDDYYILKLDSKGNIIWQKMYGGGGYDAVNSISQTNDESYIVAGFSNSWEIPGVKYIGDYDYYILKLDSKGNIIWHNKYGEGLEDYPHSIQQTKDGGYIVAGEFGVASGNDLSYDIGIVKVDSHGNLGK
ncbi:MAG: hypothetical protein AMQ22_02142 [Candidatus Methanofastidiosum methylothiophilum]|uniref:Beta-propeller repeat protein n=1 Tax=Candidatus Methanofastidiosum methylothiophilum TaxID=1705564 RepID=A0A150INM4_9EURY|nr:MAG: hypothetical protein AMQ22_02142 [Candidatus Methanofastidiosum methylthiophilus]